MSEASEKLFYECGNEDSDYVTDAWCINNGCDYFQRDIKRCKQGVRVYIGLPVDGEGGALEFLDQILEVVPYRDKVGKMVAARARELRALLPEVE